MNAVQPRWVMPLWESAVKSSMAPLTTQKMPSSAASTSRVRSTWRTAHRPTMMDTTASKASSTRVPAR